MHIRAYRTKRLSGLFVPYLRMGIPTIFMLAGLAGFLEIFHHVRAAAVGETTMSLLGIEFDSHSVTPWVIVSVLTVVGGFLAKTQSAQLKDAWETANAPLTSGKGASS